MAVVAAIYATIGPAGVLAVELRERGILEASFFVVLGIVTVLVAIHCLRQRPGWSEIGVGLAVAFAYWLSLVRIANPGERTHMVEYGVVAALIHQALQERARNGRTVTAPTFLTVVSTTVIGFIDEIIQALLPGRFFDVRDIFFNFIAGFMVVVARLALAPVRGPGWRLWFLWLMAAAFGWGWGIEIGFAGELRSWEPLAALPPFPVPEYRSLAIGGALAAVFQWLTLRRYMPNAFRWVVATGVGVCSVGILALAAYQLDPNTSWILDAFLFGPIIAGFQWLVLRKEVTKAAWWIAASVAGWLPGIPLGGLVGPPALGASYAVITGAVLVWLLRQYPRT